MAGRRRECMRSSRVLTRDSVLRHLDDPECRTPHVVVLDSPSRLFDEDAKAQAAGVAAFDDTITKGWQRSRRSAIRQPASWPQPRGGRCRRWVRTTGRSGRHSARHARAPRVSRRVLAVAGAAVLVIEATVPDDFRVTGRLVIGVNVPYAPNEFKDDAPTPEESRWSASDPLADVP
jgi:hypothetical protein